MIQAGKVDYTSIHYAQSFGVETLCGTTGVPWTRDTAHVTCERCRDRIAASLYANNPSPGHEGLANIRADLLEVAKLMGRGAK